MFWLQAPRIAFRTKISPRTESCQTSEPPIMQRRISGFRVIQDAASKLPCSDEEVAPIDELLMAFLVQKPMHFTFLQDCGNGGNALLNMLAHFAPQYVRTKLPQGLHLRGPLLTEAYQKNFLAVQAELGKCWRLGKGTVMMDSWDDCVNVHVKYEGESPGSNYCFYLTTVTSECGAREVSATDYSTPVLESLKAFDCLEYVNAVVTDGSAPCVRARSHYLMQCLVFLYPRIQIMLRMCCWQTLDSFRL